MSNTAYVPALVVLVGLVAGLACGRARDGAARGPDDGSLLIHLDLGRRATDEIVGYYVGGMLEPPSDPFKAGVVVRDDGDFFLRTDSLALTNPWAADQLRRAATGTDRIGWEDFAALMESTHSRMRRQPLTVDMMTRALKDSLASSEVVELAVTGVMSTMRRTVIARRRDLVSAVQEYAAHGNRIIYPVGTVFIARHHDADSLKEVTAMRKREDGHWDFFVFGRDGRPALSTLAKPRSLRVPTQCVGCHFGSKLYEPEKSFPAPAAVGPYGPRIVHVGEAESDPEVARFFDEHRRRSDHVLGLYATTFVSRLRHDRRAGTIDADGAELLEQLGL